MKFDLNNIIQGDCLDIMRQLPSAAFNLIVTSPPYNLNSCKLHYFIYILLSKQIISKLKKEFLIQSRMQKSYKLKLDE